MHAHEVIGEGGCSTLHVVPEGLHIWAVEQLCDHGIIRPLARGPRRDITLQAARVISETEVGIGERSDWIGCRALVCREDGTKVDRPVLKRTGSHTTTSTSVRDADQRRVIGRDTVKGLVLAASDTVASH